MNMCVKAEKLKIQHLQEVQLHTLANQRRSPDEIEKFAFGAIHRTPGVPLSKRWRSWGLVQAAARGGQKNVEECARS